MKCFVIMPFRPKFDAVYKTIRAAVEAADVGEALRLDEVRAAGYITDDLLAELQAADFCVADMSDPNANVMWEVGYAAALRKPTIVVRHTHDPLPFDVQNVRVEYYDLQAPDTLHDQLVHAITQTVTRYASRRIQLPARTATTIAITGSMGANPDLVARRLQTLLPPYFGEQTTWYCGTVGTVDELAAEYLLNAGQRVIGVGYAQLDVSSRMLQILEAHKASFVDASREQLLKIAGAPTPRDLLFAQKADLMMLLWDGKSQGTVEILNWVRQQGKDHLLGFV